MGERDITTIQVTKELKSFLSSQAISKGETYDQILRRLLSKIGVKFKAQEGTDNAKVKG